MSEAPGFQFVTAAYVIRIVTHAKASLNRLGKTHGGPTVGIEACGPRPGPIDFRHARKLFRRQTAGTARSATFAQRLYSPPTQRAVPPGGGGPANPEFSGDLGLREPPLQVLCGHQAPALHFIASQNPFSGCIHVPRAVT